ncbi:MAG TPA: TlpA disulfide reductase family protein [Planctomycetota bacterium]|nr:TlpA disulfide reductase family protein [Planctomycetota bacterium]
MPALAPGSLLPDFDLPLVGGGRARSSDFVGRGRATLVVFFKTECPTCKLAFPFLQRIWERVRASGDGAASFLSIAQNRAEEIPAFFAGYGATFPVATEGEPYPVADACGITNVPTLFVADEHGVVLKTTVGFSRAELDAVVRELESRAGSATGASLFRESDSGVPVLQPG